MNDAHQHFIKKYGAYTNSCKHVFREIVGTNPTVVGTVQEVHGGLQVIEREGVQINMSRAAYDELCETLHELEIEKRMRYSDSQLYKLYIEYITWLNLKK